MTWIPEFAYPCHLHGGRPWTLLLPLRGRQIGDGSRYCKYKSGHSNTRAPPTCQTTTPWCRTHLGQALSPGVSPSQSKTLPAMIGELDRPNGWYVTRFVMSLSTTLESRVWHAFREGVGSAGEPARCGRKPSSDSGAIAHQDACRFRWKITKHGPGPGFTSRRHERGERRLQAVARIGDASKGFATPIANY